MFIISVYKIFSRSLCSIIVDTINGKYKKLELTETNVGNSRTASAMVRATVSVCVAVQFFSRSMDCLPQKQGSRLDMSLVSVNAWVNASFRKELQACKSTLAVVANLS
ncbi:MAG: hypothetical protein VB079_02005 [Petrimonas sp.]|uniref:hypothetical protein n=1 Tax=Petrimonas sp. TaxID=2023866 RepID=UPI002B39EA20|nr:hypothetical protein [Petrimonas sp.]